MKFFTWLNKDIKSLRGGIPTFLAIYLLVPIILGLFYGFTFTKITNRQINLEQINVYMEKDNFSVSNKAIQSLLDEVNFANVIATDNVTNAVNMDAESLGILIDKNNVNIITNGANSTEKSIIVKYVKDLSPLLTSSKSSNLSEILSIYQKNHTIDKKLLSTKNPTSLQIMLVSVFSAVSLFISIDMASEFLRNRRDNVINRLISINIHSSMIHIYGSISVFILSLVTIILYAIISYGAILKLNIINIELLVILILQASLVTSIYSLSIGLFKNVTNYKNTILPILILGMIIGGSFFPITMFPKVFTISTIMPNYIIIKLTNAVLAGKSLSTLTTPLLILMAEIVAAFSVGLTSFKYKNKGCLYD